MSRLLGRPRSRRPGVDHQYRFDRRICGTGRKLRLCASKGAIKMFTQSLAQELAPSGVRVNALAPGVIETPMTEAT
jgi:NAD(P)-dependent dehydrogenase (short-subunit alcohol dehydrogenase family)